MRKSKAKGKGKGKGEEGKGTKRKRSIGGGGGVNPFFAKIGRNENGEAFPHAKRAPLKIVTWNANGLGNRLKYDKEKLASFLNKERPDVLCVQGDLFYLPFPPLFLQLTRDPPPPPPPSPRRLQRSACRACRRTER